MPTIRPAYACRATSGAVLFHSTTVAPSVLSGKLLAQDVPARDLATTRRSPVRRPFSFLACCFLLTASARSQDVIFPDNQPANKLGGLMIIRQGDQTTVSASGGAIAVPKKGQGDYRDAGRSDCHAVHDPVIFPTFQTRRRFRRRPQRRSRVSIPDSYGLLYVEGEMLRTKGTVRQLQSPPLPPGTSYPLRLRAAFQAGDQLLIEDKVVSIRAGDTVAVTFDGTGALSVPLPRAALDVVSVPRR